MAVIGNTAGLVTELLNMLEALSRRINVDVEVYSGKRQGPVDASAHNSGIAADIVIAGSSSVAIADHLVAEGFSAVGEYYRTDGSEWSTAHGDIRGLPGSENSGAYAPGGTKASKRCWTGEGDPPATPVTTPGRRSGNRCPQDQ